MCFFRSVFLFFGTDRYGTERTQSRLAAKAPPAKATISHIDTGGASTPLTDGGSFESRESSPGRAEQTHE